MLLQQIVNGLITGSIYALIAVGVSMVFKSLGVLNMANGDTLMIACFVGLILFRLGLPLFAVIILAIIIVASLGFVLERYIYRRLDYTSFVSLLIATIGVSTVLRNGASLIYRSQPQSFPELFSTVPVFIGNIRITPSTIGIICVTALLVVILNLFYGKTALGIMMRAAASDATAASMLGIDVDKMRFLTFGISAGIAAIAGLLMAPTYLVRPTLAVLAMTKGFASALIGGLGDINGAITGGILLGIVEALIAAYISTAYRDVVAFLLLLIIITIVPYGIFGKSVEEKL